LSHSSAISSKSSLHAIRRFAGRGNVATLLVPPRPASSTGRVPVAPHTPRLLVIAATLARVRDRLFKAGPQLVLDRVLHLFDITSASDKAFAVNRDALASLLGHLRLGISAAEAEELVSFW